MIPPPTSVNDGLWLEVWDKPFFGLLLVMVFAAVTEQEQTENLVKGLRKNMDHQVQNS